MSTSRRITIFPEAIVIFFCLLHLSTIIKLNEKFPVSVETLLKRIKGNFKGVTRDKAEINWFDNKNNIKFHLKITSFANEKLNQVLMKASSSITKNTDKFRCY